MLTNASYHHDQIEGFHVATCEMPFSESVSVGFYIPVGSRHEDSRLNGIAHFAEHMIFKGTQQRSARDIAIAIEGAGGTVNAYTTEDQTCLEARGPAELMEHMLQIMGDMLWHSTYAEAELEKERDVISEEIAMYYENPSEHLHDLLSEVLWGQHALGLPITGSEQSILQIDSKELKSFTSKQYTCEGLSIVVAGKAKHIEVLNTVRAIMPSGHHLRPSCQHFQRPIETQGASLLHQQRDIEQIHFAAGFHTEGRHSENRHVLRMLSLLLGETMSSRMFQELRESLGLCYHISTDFSLFEDTGTFEIDAAFDHSKLDESLEAISRTLSQIKSTGFSQEELDQAKRFALGQAKISLESPHSQMGWMGDSLTSFGKIIDPVETRNLLDSVTLTEVQDLSQLLFTNNNLHIASIGPVEHSSFESKVASLAF
ncbi:M16 family metallopeptidase [Rubritalea marina]|uniref:M16 family metallopeptidase n=1 Tax=Rubritalea marina TaxID=361055 RepID=UPI00037D924B|nr:pitrilysin family protein [Rubritalea marina]